MELYILLLLLLLALVIIVVVVVVVVVVVDVHIGGAREQTISSSRGQMTEGDGGRGGVGRPRGVGGGKAPART